jgi:transcriptional regulator with XRE-family HTH domain
MNRLLPGSGLTVSERFGMDDREVPDAMRPQLGVCLRAARQARGLTLKQVAERTGMALSTLSQVENNQMSLTYDKLLQLTFGLKMQIAELFNPANLRAEPAPVVTGRRSNQPRQPGTSGRHKILHLQIFMHRSDPEEDGPDRGRGPSAHARGARSAAASCRRGIFFGDPRPDQPPYRISMHLI